MPRPRRGMFRDPRYRGWLWRDRRGGRDVWHRLGENFGEACEEYDRLQRVRDPRGGSRLLVSDVAADWQRLDVQTRRRSDSGRKSAKISVERHLVPLLGALRIRDLRDDHCREYAAHLAGKGLKPWSVRHVLDDLRRMLRWCVSTGRLERSPFPSEIIPRIGRREPRPYSDAEVATLCALPAPHGFLCRWAIESMLAWSDLVRSTAAMIDENGLLACTRGKTGQISIVPVSSAMRAEIRVRIGPLVPYSLKSHGSVARDIRVASGIEDFTLHRLRHTGAMLRLRAGWSKDELQVMLGHTSVTTTEIYAGVTRRMLEEKAARMSAQTVVSSVVGAPMPRIINPDATSI